MNKNEFLVGLEKNLKGLPKEEIQDRLDYYIEYLNDLGIDEETNVEKKGIVLQSIINEALNEDQKGLERKIMEVEYDTEEIKRLEAEVLFPEVTILTANLKMEDDKNARKTAYAKMLNKVVKSLNKDEEIILKTIIVTNPMSITQQALMVYNKGVFLTNQRLFIFYMDYKYRELEKVYISSLEDIKYINYNKELQNIVLNFKDKTTCTLAAYRKADKRLLFILLKYLVENEIKFEFYKDKINVYLISALVILALVFTVVPLL